MATEQRLGPSREASVVLDIGGDVGALVVYATAEWLGREIDLLPVDPRLPHTHSAVRERNIGSRALYAAVYPALTAGAYRLEGSSQSVTIEGGRITELFAEISS